MSDRAVITISEDAGWRSRALPGSDLASAGANRPARLVSEVAPEVADVGHSERGAGETQSSEWGSTLNLVQKACESLRTSEERVRSLERELEQAAIESRDDLRKMLARFQAAQEDIKNANARAKAFEARAIEAESWLARLNEAIVDGFGEGLNGQAAQAD